MSSIETYRLMGISGLYRMTNVMKLRNPTVIGCAGSKSIRVLDGSNGAPSFRYQCAYKKSHDLCSRRHGS